jgi:sugar O-acyltransferase (sialic acid O-acetyltransferase NeuD family)
MKSVSKPIIVIGGGGHAGVILDILKSENREILGFSSIQKVSAHSVFNNIPQLMDDEAVFDFDPNDVVLVNGIGPSPEGNLRHKIFMKFSDCGFQFEKVIAASAYVSFFSSIGPGVQIFPNASVQTEAIISENAVINTGAIIEHNCLVGARSHIAPGAILCGQVNVGSDVYIGAGAKIIQNISIGSGSIIAMGASVVRDVPANSLLIPGKPIMAINSNAKLEQS